MTRLNAEGVDLLDRKQIKFQEFDIHPTTALAFEVLRQLLWKDKYVELDSLLLDGKEKVQVFEEKISWKPFFSSEQSQNFYFRIDSLDWEAECRLWNRNDERGKNWLPYESVIREGDKPLRLYRFFRHHGSDLPNLDALTYWFNSTNVHGGLKEHLEKLEVIFPRKKKGD
ncbi:MAG: hypothetical protein A3E92_03430 [Candidatus Taylorbacteria bacterium RIFCSPHIGHO2_12_FULL_42_34]|nr:MAG: hypothetical protein A3E92_03430 [Candidatus Taylorbacteria bacterium RIFCSPHIGHO2_12_FULL_42_34]